MERDGFEMDKSIVRAGAVIGIIAGVIALVVGIIALFSMKDGKGAARDLAEKMPVQDTAVPEPARMGALMVDTRAEKGESDGKSLIDILGDRQVYFAGIENAVISSDTVISLENMEENEDILMQYEITDKESGEVLETTGLIPAGEQVAWKPGEKLKTGTYTLVFHEMPFFPFEGEYVALTQGNNEVTITIQ